MQMRTRSNSSRQVVRSLAICLPLLLCTGCQTQDATPEWWYSFPSGFLGWNEPLSRVLVLLVPVGIAFAFAGAFEDGQNDGCEWFFVPYILLLFLVPLGELLLSTISYGVSGIMHYVTIPFACFSAGLFLIAITLIVLLALVGGLFSDASIVQRSLGLIGLILEGFGLFFTIRDIFGLLNNY